MTAEFFRDGLRRRSLDINDNNSGAITMQAPAQGAADAMPSTRYDSDLLLNHLSETQ